MMDASESQPDARTLAPKPRRYLVGGLLNGLETRTLQGSGGSAVTTGYGYNGAGTMTSATAAIGTTTTLSATYGYDSDGLRTTATTTTSAGTVTNTFTWDTTPAVPELLDDSTNSYLYGPDSTPYAQISDSTGTTTYLHLDPQHNTRLLTSSTGTITGTQSYNDYGTITASSTWTTPFGYAGEYTDPTGLTYLRARYYDPTTAQFLATDSLEGLTGDPYGYGDQDPFHHIDPLGLWGWNPISDAEEAGTATVGTVAAGASWAYHNPAVVGVALGGVALAATGVGLITDAGLAAGAGAADGLVAGAAEAVGTDVANSATEASVSLTTKTGQGLGYFSTLTGAPALYKDCTRSIQSRACITDIGLTAAGAFLAYLGRAPRSSALGSGLNPMIWATLGEETAILGLPSVLDYFGAAC